MSKNGNKKTSIDIHNLLQDDSQYKKKKEKAQLLNSLGIKDYFKEGNMQIDMKTCRGVECQLCIKICPTNALYWKSGEVGITEQLCTFCAACVLSCIVDDCIRITRKRSNGETESFSKPADVIKLINRINAQNRRKMTEARTRTIESTLKKKQE